MVSVQNASLLEPISHVTQSRPISFHHTIADKGTKSILYLHWHSEVEFLLVEQGETIFYIEEKEYHLRAGDAIFIPANLLHMAKGINGSDCEFYAIVFSPAYLFDSNMNLHYTKYMLPLRNYSLRYPLQLTPSISWHKDILELLKSMYLLSQGLLEQWELQMYGMLLMVWQWLYNNHLSKITADTNNSILVRELDYAISYIHCAYNDMITLSKLASISHLSEGQFCRQFKKLTGFSPFSYLNRFRIMKSCEYLSNTSKKVTEIATLCGFNNISYYNREFIKYIKITPSAYRKTIRN